MAQIASQPKPLQESTMNLGNSSFSLCWAIFKVSTALSIRLAKLSLNTCLRTASKWNPKQKFKMPSKVWIKIYFLPPELYDATHMLAVNEKLTKKKVAVHFSKNSTATRYLIKWPLYKHESYTKTFVFSKELKNLHKPQKTKRKQNKKTKKQHKKETSNHMTCLSTHFWGQIFPWSISNRKLVSWGTTQIFHPGVIKGSFPLDRQS